MGDFMEEFNEVEIPHLAKKELEIESPLTPEEKSKYRFFYHMSNNIKFITYILGDSNAVLKEDLQQAYRSCGTHYVNGPFFEIFDKSIKLIVKSQALQYEMAPYFFKNFPELMKLHEKRLQSLDVELDKWFNYYTKDLLIKQDESKPTEFIVDDYQQLENRFFKVLQEHLQTVAVYKLVIDMIEKKIIKSREFVNKNDGKNEIDTEAILSEIKSITERREAVQKATSRLDFIQYIFNGI